MTGEPNTTDLADATATELLGLFAAGTASPSEAVAACLERIEATQPDANTIITLLDDQARAQARESDARWAAGTARPLEGVPYGLKDIIATAGIRTTGGSRCTGTTCRTPTRCSRPDWPRPAAC